MAESMMKSMILLTKTLILKAAYELESQFESIEIDMRKEVELKASLLPPADTLHINNCFSSKYTVSCDCKNRWLSYTRGHRPLHHVQYHVQEYIQILHPLCFLMYFLSLHLNSLIWKSL